MMNIEMSREEEDTIFRDIEDLMFGNVPDSDIVEYELKNLRDGPQGFVNPDYYDQRVAFRTKQLDAVINRLHCTVMKHYTAFVEGIVQIQQITQELTTTGLLCNKGRKYLVRAQENAVQGSMIILRNNRRKKYLQQVQIYAKDMKRQIDRNLLVERLLKDSDFFTVIDIIKKAKEEEDFCSGVVSLKTHLSGWQQNAIVKMSIRLDDYLRECCTNFNPTTYQKTLSGYRSVGKLYEVSGKLTKYYMDRIEQISMSIVKSAALKNIMDKVDDFHMLPFSSIIQHITPEDVLPTLLQLQQELAHILHNYVTMSAWHENLQQNKKQSSTQNNTLEGEKSEDITKAYQDIQYGLKRSKRTVWETIQIKISNFITSYRFDGDFTFELFLQVLHSCNMVMYLGSHFAASNSGDNVCLSLRGAMRAQCKSFLDAWHKKNVEKLKQMLLLEKYVQIYQKINSVGDFKMLTTAYITSTQRNEHNLFARKFVEEDDPACNPFAVARDTFKVDGDSRWETLFEKDEKSNDLPYSLTSKIPDHSEIVMDEDDEEDSPKPPASPTNGTKPQYPVQSGVLFTQTTLQVSKMLCKYIKLCQVFPLHGVDAVKGMEELFGIYLYTTMSIFGTLSRDHYVPDKDPQIPAHCRDKLQEFRRCIHDYTGIDAESSPLSTENFLYVQQPTIVQQLYNSNCLFAIPERFTATFSWEFPCKLFKVLSTMASTVVPSNQQTLLKNADKLTKYCNILKDIEMQRVCHHLFVTDHFPQIIEKAQEWSKKDVELSASSYVQLIEKDLHNFQQKMHNALLRLPCARTLVKMLWLSVAWNLWFVLIEGFSKVKKTPEHRPMQMTVDARTLENTLKNLAGFPPPGMLEYVFTYINSWHLQGKNELYEFIQKNSCKYSSKQLNALAVCGYCANLKKGEKKDVMSQIDNIILAGRKQFAHDFAYDEHYRINRYMDD